MVNEGAHGEAATQLLAALPLAYMAGACYYSLFQLGMFSFYHVVPRATNAHSLLMNAAQVRFTSPQLCGSSQFICRGILQGHWAARNHAVWRRLLNSARQLL